MGDRRLDVARAGPRVPAQPVGDDDAVRQADGGALRLAGRLPRRGRHRGGGDHGALGGAAPAPRARAVVRPAVRAALARTGPGARAADRPGADPRRLPRRHGRHRQGGARPRRRWRAPRSPRACTAFGHTEVTGFELERGAGPRGRDHARARSAPGTVVLAAGIWGPKVARLAGVRLPLTPVRAPVRGHGAAARAGRRDARGRAPDPAPPGRRPLLPPARRRLRDRQLRPRAAARRRRGDPAVDGRRRAAVDPAVHARGLRARRRGDGAAPARRRPRAARALLRRPDVVHARRHAADRRGRRRPRAVAVRGDLGHARRRRGPGARRADRPRRRPHGPARVRPAALRRARAGRTYARARGAQQYREVYDVLHPRQQNEQLRAPAAHAAVARAARARRRLLRERGLGAAAVVRGQRAASTTARSLPRARLAGAAVVADRRRRAPRLPRAGRACSTSRRSPRSRCTARARSRFLQELAGQRRRPPGRHDRLHGDVRAARRDHVRPHDHAPGRGPLPGRHRRRGRPARHRVDDPAPAVGRLGRARGQDVRRCAASASGARGRATSSPRSARTTSPTRRSRTWPRASSTSARCRCARCGSPTSASSAGSSTRPTEFGLALWDAAVGGGRRHGVVACGGAAYDSLRLEKGYRLWGQDIDEEHDPYEAGLGWAVRLEKGPFIGRDALAAAKSAASRAGCAASSPTTRASCWSARSRSSTATRRSAT